MCMAALYISNCSRAEEKLRSAYRRGASVNFNEDRSSKLFGDAGKVIRAQVIRELLLDHEPLSTGQIRRLDLAGAIIHGRLDLRFAKVECPLSLTGCRLDSVPDLTEAHLGPVSLRECTLPGMQAEHVTVSGDLDLAGSHLGGQLQLRGARLEEDLHLKNAVISSSGSRRGPLPDSDEKSLDLTGCHIEGNLDAERLIVYGQATTASVTVDGSLTMTDARVWAKKGTDAWDGDGMKVAADLDASGLKATGAVRLVSTQVLVLNLRGAEVKNTGHALLLDRLESHGSVWCDEVKLTGGMKASGVKVGQTLYLGGALVFAAHGRKHSTAVDLSRAEITGDLSVRRRENAAEFSAVGDVNLAGARIGGQFALIGAGLESADGGKRHPALTADFADIGADVLVSDFTCAGVMSFRNARIGGQLKLAYRKDAARDAKMLLDASGVRVALDVDASAGGAVNLRKAQVGQDITVSLGNLSSDDEHAAADLSCAQAAVLTLRGRQTSGKLDLTHASVRRLVDKSERPLPGSLVLDGFEYEELEGQQTDPAYRLDWLKAGTMRVRQASGDYEKIRFAPQPYLQLAATYQRSGRDHDRRSVLCRMHRERNSAESWRHWYSKLWNYAQDGTLGYGYVPSRALIWLLGISVFSSLWLTYSPGKRAGLLQSSIITLGLILPGSGYDKIEKWVELSTWSHLVASFIVLIGLVLGATTIAALARILKQ